MAIFHDFGSEFFIGSLRALRRLPGLARALHAGIRFRLLRDPRKPTGSPRTHLALHSSLHPTSFMRVSATSDSLPQTTPKTPKALSEPLLELCRRLEERGIATWSQGEGLLEDLRPKRRADPTAAPAPRCLLCSAEPEELLEALPRAVVTASGARRLSLATSAGPIDLLPVGRGDLEAVLLDFGLSPFAFAFRPLHEQWCDPVGARAAFQEGILELNVDAPNPFEIAPRRYWIAARLMAEHALVASSKLLTAARETLPDTLDRLPMAAPARREVSRILASPAADRGLAFLREAGLSAALFPGMDPAGESIVARLGPLPALRWAAWLHGSAIQRALVRFRMPPALARRIERVHRAHPIDRHTETLTGNKRELGVHKILARLGEDEIEGLFAWRRLELAAAGQTEKTRNRSKRLEMLQARLEEILRHRERSGQVRALALDGKAVMGLLGAKPGPQVGAALAHLAVFVESHPDSNEAQALERELRDWAAKNG